MSYRYRTYKKKFQKNGKLEEKYFAVAKSTCLLSIEELAQEIGQRSIVKESTIIPVLIELSNVMGDKLTHGYNIKLEKIGTFGVAVKSKGYDTPSEITPKQVKFSKLTFRPDKELVNKLKAMKYEKEPPPPKGCVSRKKQHKEEEKQQEQSL
jgi:predicted histone-like DNA-binding protein